MRRRKPALISVLGSKNSGKTTVIETLTRELTKRGYYVAAVKHIPERDFTIDKEGKDTWRFAKAGAKTIVAISPTEIATIEKIDTKGLALNDIVKKCMDSDVVIIEGFRKLLEKNMRVPKIVTVKSTEEIPENLKIFKPIIAFAGLQQLKVQLNTPNVNASKDGGKLADLVENFIKKKGKGRF
ncbi:MAG: molybdopterin-guanine dinucleotide biosynthesis protein B [Candidatus Bathyarchaeia archaeon]